MCALGPQIRRQNGENGRVSAPFELICEIEPPTRPDLMHVRHQIGVLSKVASAFLVPDNHLGRATVSSIAVAHEVAQMGGRSIACINARDRNLLGFRRDLLTASAYGVTEFLFVHGDEPASGVRSGDLSVRGMIDEARHSPVPDPRVGVATRLRPVPAWKLAADFLFVQVSFSLDALLRWRDTITFDGPVYAGVLVLSSAPMARKLAADVDEIEIPPDWIEAVERDRLAAVDKACELTIAIRDSGAFAGVHLVPVARYREVAGRLEGAL